MIRGGMTVTVRGWRGIAFDVIRRRGNKVQAVMVGDDLVRTVDAVDCTPISQQKYCSCCGQVGCHS